MTLSSKAATLFAGYGGGHYSVLPQQLVVAEDADGDPVFCLELIKRMGDLTPAGQYAVLDFALDADFRLDDALQLARSSTADAAILPAAVHSGFARLYPTTSQVLPEASLLDPVPLGWTGAHYARWISRLSVLAGELLKGAILAGNLLLGARVEFEVAGVAPRVPVAVEFDPATLLQAILSGRANRQIPVSDVLAFFTGPTSGWPVKLSAPPTPELSQPLADRIIAAYATLIPAPAVTDPAYVQFNYPGQVDAGTVQWDLSQPAAVFRQYVLTLDPLSTLAPVVASGGGDKLIRDVVVPPLNFGIYNIDLTADLPRNRVGVPALGVNLQVAAHPPSRPSSISKTVTLSEPEDRASVQLQLTPRESLAYTTSGFAIVVAGQNEWQFQSAPCSRSDDWTKLTMDDFPVLFAHLSAASRLLAMAKLAVTLTCTIDDRNIQQQFEMNTGVSDLSLAIPRSATNAQIVVTAVPADGSPALTMPAMPPGRIPLDVTSFPGYGPHIVSIACSFGESGSAPLFLDLLREDQPEDSTDGGKVVLTPDQPSATWGYFAASPFHGGYRYRRSASIDMPAGEWAAPLSPFSVLQVNGEGLPCTAASAISIPTGPA